MRNKQKLKIRKMTFERALVGGIFLFLTLYTILTLFLIDRGGVPFISGLKDFFKNLGTLFFKAALSERTSFRTVLKSLSVTFSLSLLTTLIASFFAFFFSVFAAENLSFSFISKAVRSLMAFIRAIPTIIWVLIFAASGEIGSAAAVMGMCFHSTAYLVKGFSESFEKVDKNVIDALRSTGARKCEIFLQAVLPSSLTHLISWIFFRFEINFALCVALGAAAGAGGIGFDLFMAGSMYFDIKEVGALGYFIFSVAFLLEFTSLKIRSALNKS